MAKESASELSLNNDHEFFTSMLDLIPTSFYYKEDFKKLMREDNQDEDSEEEFEQLAQKPGQKNKKRVAVEDPSAKAERKKAKFDPTQIKTVSQLTEHIAAKEKAAKGGKGSKTKQKSGAKGPGPNDWSISTPTKNVGMPSEASPSSEDLRLQLKVKIDSLREKRKALGREDEIQKKRLKRQESKAKLKMKRHKQKHEKSLPNGQGMVTPKPKTPIPATPVFNREGKMVFSKFDFSEKKEKKPEKKNYKKLLETMQKSKDKLKDLEQTDSSAAQSLKQKQQWKSVLQKAEGIRVKDNPDLIKKTIKRVEKRKEKSRKEWKDRTDKVDTEVKQRQKKRTVNIKKKKDGRINKKISKQKKKGRIIPGF